MEDDFNPNSNQTSTPIGESDGNNSTPVIFNKTEDQNITNIPKQRTGHLNPITKLILFIVIIVVCSGGVYYWQHKQVTNLNQQALTLNSEVKTLQGSVKNMDIQLNKGSTIFPSSPNSPSIDGATITSTTPSTNVTGVFASKTYNNTDKNYLVLQDWGIKIKLGSADPSKISYYYETGGNAGGAEGVVDGTVVLQIQTLLLNGDTSCQSLGLVIDRQYISEIPTGAATPSLQLGSFQYSITGSPFSCGNTALDTIRTQYTGNNPGSWKFSYIN
jgi:hypothetical protein